MSEKHERAIIKVINRYGLAMDTQTWDLFDQIFAADVEAIYPSARWHDVATFKKDFARGHEHYDATQHMMINPLVDVSGETARSFTYCAFRLIKRGAPGGNFVEGSAWYDDAWTRKTGDWLISRRACRILWSEGNPNVSLARGKGAPPLEWNSLRTDARNGEVGYLEALLGR